MKIEASAPEAASVMSSQANDLAGMIPSLKEFVSDGRFREAYKLMPSIRERVNALFANLEAYLDEAKP